MRVLPVTALCLAVALAPVAAADAGTATLTYIDHATWVSYGGLSSLRVYPTGAGRQVARQLDKTAEQAEQAWLEVLAVAPDANTAAMRSQFVCHWNFAELAEPQKCAIADDICGKTPVKKEYKSAQNFFGRFRYLAASGYYTTPQGWKDIGYTGNVPTVDFAGPTPEALKHLGLA